MINNHLNKLGPQRFPDIAFAAEVLQLLSFSGVAAELRKL
jgi:hypothetical protein